MRQLEPPLFVSGRSREGTLHMAEQFAFQQPRRQRRAMDADERPIAARAVVVNGFRKQLLAGAALSSDQHTRFTDRHFANSVEDAFQCRAVSDDRVAPELKCENGR